MAKTWQVPGDAARCIGDIRNIRHGEDIFIAVNDVRELDAFVQFVRSRLTKCRWSPTDRVGFYTDGIRKVVAYVRSNGTLLTPADRVKVIEGSAPRVIEGSAPRVIGIKGWDLRYLKYAYLALGLPMLEDEEVKAYFLEDVNKLVSVSTDSMIPYWSLRSSAECECKSLQLEELLAPPTSDPAQHPDEVRAPNQPEGTTKSDSMHPEHPAAEPRVQLQDDCTEQHRAVSEVVGGSKFQELEPQGPGTRQPTVEAVGRRRKNVPKKIVRGSGEDDAKEKNNPQ